MKKKLIALALIIIVALAAMEGLYLLLRRAHNARQAEPVAARAPIAEATPEIPDQAQIEAPRTKRPEFIGEPSFLSEPTGEQSFDDLAPEKQKEFLDAREAHLNRMYAARCGKTIEEWNALTPKEQRILIRKGKRQ